MKHRLLIALTLAALAQSARAQPQTELVNGVAAIVNGKAITIKEIRRLMADDQDKLEIRFARQPELLQRNLKALMAESVEILVERRLILDEFAKAGYNQHALDTLIETRINRDIRNTYGDMLTLKKTLQTRGITYEEYRQSWRERTIVEAMREHFVPRDPVISPSKIETYYREHQDRFQMKDQAKLRIITLTKKPGDDADSVRKRAREIVGKLDEGAPFDGMAKIYSQDTQAASGGDRGWIDKSVLRSELTDIAFSLKPGQRSDVIDTPEACYILLVEDLKSAHVRPLSDVRDEIEVTLKGEEQRRLHLQWIKRLKEKSHIQYF
jgi:parvulin-like peptidyl-prolyl isomerase